MIKRHPSTREEIDWFKTTCKTTAFTREESANVCNLYRAFFNSNADCCTSCKKFSDWFREIVTCTSLYLGQWEEDLKKKEEALRSQAKGQKQADSSSYTNAKGEVKPIPTKKKPKSKKSNGN